MALSLDPSTTPARPRAPSPDLAQLLATPIDDDAGDDAWLTETLVRLVRSGTNVRGGLREAISGLTLALPEPLVRAAKARARDLLAQGTPHWRPEVEVRAGVVYDLTEYDGTVQGVARHWGVDPTRAHWILNAVWPDAPGTDAAPEGLPLGGARPTRKARRPAVSPLQRQVLALVAEHARLSAPDLERLQDLGQQVSEVQMALGRAGRAINLEVRQWRRRPREERARLAATSDQMEGLLRLAEDRDETVVAALAARADLSPDVQEAVAHALGLRRAASGLEPLTPTDPHRRQMLIARLAAARGAPTDMRRAAQRELLASTQQPHPTDLYTTLTCIRDVRDTLMGRLDPRPPGDVPWSPGEAARLGWPRSELEAFAGLMVGAPPELRAHLDLWWTAPGGAYALATERPELPRAWRAAVGAQMTTAEAIGALRGADDVRALADVPGLAVQLGPDTWQELLAHPRRDVRVAALALRGLAEAERRRHAGTPPPAGPTR